LVWWWSRYFGLPDAMTGILDTREKIDKSPRVNGPVTLLGQSSGFGPKGRCPMTFVLLTASEISLALALGFVLGRIYQIRRAELERGFTLPPTARIPQP
jgi:hypothetical protein